MTCGYDKRGRAYGNWKNPSPSVLAYLARMTPLAVVKKQWKEYAR